MRLVRINRIGSGVELKVRGVRVMDLLGSILSSMEKPPENKEEKKARMSEFSYEWYIIT